MNMNGTSTPARKTGSPTPQQPKAVTTKSRGLCRRFGDCIVMGPVASYPPRPEKSSAAIMHDKLVNQVSKSDKELEEQRELTNMYKAKLERTQAFLKYCLQVSQEHGFLDFILNNLKDHDKESVLSPTITSSSISPQSPSPVQCHPELVALTHQAKTGGWYINPTEIELLHLSAEGSTADVYKGRWRSLDVAIKCMYPDYFRSNENGVSFFSQEVETLSRQRHPFVLQLIGACLDPPQNCWIVTEFLATNLKDWLHGRGTRHDERTTPLPPLKERIAKALEIALAMQYLHASKPKILHRDLKPSNIFMDDALHVRVADFGHARYLMEGEKALTGETGTFVYMAPEVIQCSPYDDKCDVYSFGVILNELVTGEYPYIDSGYGPTKIALEVAERGFRPTIGELDGPMEGVIELIKRSWDQAPASRPDFVEITSILRSIVK